MTPDVRVGRYCPHVFAEWWNFIRARKERHCQRCGKHQVFNWRRWLDV